MNVVLVVAGLVFVVSGVQSQFGGTPRDNLTGVWSKTTRWTKCSVTCGIGRRVKKRKCIKGICLGETIEACNTGVKCPTYSWGEWGGWSSCSATCGRGRMVRHRECSGNRCLGAGYETEICLTYKSCHATETTTSAPNTSLQTSTSAPPTTPTSPEITPTSPSSTTTPPTTTTTTTTTTATPLSRKYCRKPVTARTLGAVSVSDCRTDPSVVNFELIGIDLKLPICSGVLISLNHALTTRRCAASITDTLNIPDISWRALAGSVTNGGQIQDVGELTFFPSGGTAWGDLAIINIPGGFVEDACTVPVCLPQATDIYKTGQSCRITGWSAEVQPDRTALVIPSNHQTANVTLISTPDCEYIYSYLPSNISTRFPVYADTVCTHAVEDRVAVCELWDGLERSSGPLQNLQLELLANHSRGGMTTDEGWSLFCKDDKNQSTLVGLAMTDTSTVCSTDRPSRFQSVQMHLDWITDILSKHESGGER